jgi:NTE family protein
VCIVEIVSRDLKIPVRLLPHEESDEQPVDGVALCLSGGGYRAMLFHLGVLWRLNEAGWLPRLTRVSSVSGGSITAALLGLAWDELDFQADVAANFKKVVVAQVRSLAGHTIDRGAVLVGLASPFTSVGQRVAGAYDKLVFHGKTLNDLPDAPVFVINATNMESGALFRFTKSYIADWRVGRVPNAGIDIATAVACSSAFPPFLSPYRLNLRGMQWQDDEGNTLAGADYRNELDLSDGGVYDNLGLETAFKRCRCLFVSDGGGHISDNATPARDWGRHAGRVVQVLDNQVRSLRKRQLVAAYKAKLRAGAYVGIRSDITRYKQANTLPAPLRNTRELAAVPTRLKALDDRTQCRLINWGYAIADAGLRKHADPGADQPRGFPYPVEGVG